MTNKAVFAALISTIFASGCAFDAAEDTDQYSDGLSQEGPAYYDEADPAAADPTTTFDDVAPGAAGSSKPGFDDVEPTAPRSNQPGYDDVAPEPTTQPSDIEAKASSCTVRWIDPRTHQVFFVPCTWPPAAATQRTK